MNKQIRSSFLKEMGISEWVSKDLVLISEPKIANSEIASSGDENLANNPSTNQNPNTNEMWLFFGSKPNGDSQILFQNIVPIQKIVLFCSKIIFKIYI